MVTHEANRSPTHTGERHLAYAKAEGVADLINPSPIPVTKPLDDHARPITVDGLDSPRLIDKTVPESWSGKCCVLQEQCGSVIGKGDRSKDHLLLINRELIYDNPKKDEGIKIPSVSMILNGRRVQGLLDTGAGRTVVKSGVLENSLEPLNEWNARLTDFNGEPIPILGTRNIEISIKNDAADSSTSVKPPVKINHTVAVLSQHHSAPYQLLIGTDLLTKHQAKIDFASRLLTLEINHKRYNIPIQDLAKERVSQHVHNINEKPKLLRTERTVTPLKKYKTKAELTVHAANTFDIGPLEQRLIRVHTNIPDGEYTVHRGSADCGLLVSEALVKIKEGSVPLLLLNVSPTDLTIFKGTRLASLSPLRNLEYCFTGLTLGSCIEESNSIIESKINNVKLTDPPVSKSIDSRNLPPITPEEIDTPATAEVLKQLTELLNKYRDVVAKPGEHLGRTTVMEHAIPTDPEAGIVYKKQYPIPHSQLAELDSLVDDMLDRGVIVPSDSTWNSPIIIVRKKDQTGRACIDFRELNYKSEQSRHPIPRITELLQALSNAKFFSSLDLESAFWQIPIVQKDQGKTAFTTRKGHFHFQVLPFGLKNAPSSFSKCIALVLGEALGVHALAYFDDIIISSPTISEHLTSIEKVLMKFRLANMRVKLTKCEFIKPEIKFLGHLVTPEGIRMHPGHLDSIKNYPTPTNTDQVRSFLGLLSYFRGFVPEFSRIADPLNKLLKKEQPFVWQPEQQQAMTTLKESLMKAPILSFPNFASPFYIFTDASNVGLGAVLMQPDANNKLHPISYASRSLSEVERRYSTTKREALAVLWSLKNFRYLVYGYEVTIYTDHRPLSFLFRKSLPEGALGRWAVLTQEYDPKIIYVKGKLNNLADALSRIPYSLPELEKTGEDLKKVASKEDYEEMPSHIANVRESKPLPKVLKERVPELAWTVEELIKEQRRDSQLAVYFSHLTSNSSPNQNYKPPNDLPDYMISSGILHKRITTQRCGEEVVYWTVVVPKTLIRRAVLLCHDSFEFGHLGVARTLIKLKTHFFFSNMNTLATEIIKCCEECQRYNHLPPQRTPIRTYPLPRKPWEEVAMDIMGPLPMTSSGNRYIITFIDLLTRYLVIVPIPDRSAMTVARALREQLFAHYGAPSRLISDNALEFVSEVIRLLCEHYYVKKVNITPYRAAANGAVENRNFSIGKLLRIYTGEFSPQWDIFLPEVMIAINTAYNNTLGDNPHYALFGYDRKHVALWDGPEPFEPLYNFNDEPGLRARQAKLAHNFVRDRMYQELLKYQQKHNIHTKDREKLVLHQRVYAKYHPKITEYPKLSPRWEGPFVVTKIHSPYNYTLQHAILDKTRKVHLDHIIPCYPPLIKRAQSREDYESSDRCRDLDESTAYCDSDEEGTIAPESPAARDSLTEPAVPAERAPERPPPVREPVITRSRRIPDSEHVSLR